MIRCYILGHQWMPVSQEVVNNAVYINNRLHTLVDYYFTCINCPKNKNKRLAFLNHYQQKKKNNITVIK